MNVERLLLCLEFQVEIQELRDLGLSEEEIEGYFDFDWDCGQSLLNTLLMRGTDDQH